MLYFYTEKPEASVDWETCYRFSRDLLGREAKKPITQPQVWFAFHDFRIFQSEKKKSNPSFLLIFVTGETIQWD
jgi:hypothetical protein